MEDRGAKEAGVTREGAGAGVTDGCGVGGDECEGGGDGGDTPSNSGCPIA